MTAFLNYWAARRTVETAMNAASIRGRVENDALDAALAVFGYEPPPLVLDGKPIKVWRAQHLTVQDNYSVLPEGWADAYPLAPSAQPGNLHYRRYYQAYVIAPTRIAAARILSRDEYSAKVAAKADPIGGHSIRLVESSREYAVEQVLAHPDHLVIDTGHDTFPTVPLADLRNMVNGYEHVKRTAGAR